MALTAAAFARLGKQISENLAAVFPATLTHDGVTYACAFIPGDMTRDVEINGSVERIEGEARVAFSLMTAAVRPAPRSIVTITPAGRAATRYKVIDVGTSEHEQSWRFTLIQPGR